MNLALALGKERQRVGLLDADVFGPSLARMMNLNGVESSKPVLTSDKKIKPVLSYGIECMSMSLIQPREGSIVWRGLMVQKAIEQLLFQVQWSDLDYLVIDLPPGTGDTQLSLCQRANVYGALLVSTPQEVAISDTRKAADMFNTLKVPILGIIENMSRFVCPHCKEDSPIFSPESSKSSIENFSKSLNVSILAKLPIDPLVCTGSDEGRPLILSDAENLISRKFSEVAKFLININRN